MSTDDPPTDLVDVLLLDDDGESTRLEYTLFVELNRDWTVEGMSKDDGMVLECHITRRSTGF